MTELGNETRANTAPSRRLALWWWIWLGVTIPFALAASMLMSISYAATLGIGLALQLVLPIALLVWAVRRRVWLVAAGTVLASAGLWWGGSELGHASTQLHLMARKSTYERLIAQAEAGELVRAPGADGWTRDRRSGVRYSLISRAPVRIDFVWRMNANGAEGVRYDGARKTERAGEKTPAPSDVEAFGDGYGYYRLIF